MGFYGHLEWSYRESDFRIEFYDPKYVYDHMPVHVPVFISATRTFRRLLLSNVPEGSRMFPKVPEGSRRFSKVLEGSRKFSNALETFGMFKNVLESFEGCRMFWNPVWGPHWNILPASIVTSRFSSSGWGEARLDFLVVGGPRI
jgi:hypothetical protein